MRVIFTAIFLQSFLLANDISSLLFHGNCVTCHHETKSISAPSATEIRTRYKDAFKNKEEFVLYMTGWVLNPSYDGSLMHDAIKKHGLMPELGFDEETLKTVCEYIYETDFKEEERTHPKR